VWVVASETALVANVGDAKCVLARVAEKVRQGITELYTTTQNFCYILVTVAIIA
jgi:hypothetical protein